MNPPKKSKSRMHKYRSYSLTCPQHGIKHKTYSQQVTFFKLGPNCVTSQILKDLRHSRGGHSHIMELLMLVNQPQKWTLNGVIGKGWFATLNGVTLHISNPKWRNEPKSYPMAYWPKPYPKWHINQYLV